VKTRYALSAGFAFASVAALLACGKGSNVTLTQLSPGAQCPNGGVQINVEGQQPQIVCNGPLGSGGSSGATGPTGPGGASGPTGGNGFATLVKTTPVDAGDTHCPQGGLRVDSGLDNGAGGGTANNGVLETGEILSTQYVCNGDGGARPGSMTPPSGPDGTSSIRAVGGVGGATGSSGRGLGGSGGNLTFQITSGSYGGHVKAFRGGAADASFTFPAVPAPTYGPARANVTSSVTVAPQPSSATALPAGTLFTFNGSLYSSIGPSGTTGPTAGTQITGLSIAANTKVTFGMGSGSAVTLNIANSCLNAGAIAAGPTTGGATGSIVIVCGDYFGDINSSISTAGVAGASGSTGGTGPAPGSGGSLTVSAASFWNKGNIDASGAPGVPGGNIDIAAVFPLFNTGNITAAGGAATGPATGGSAGSITLASSFDLSNSGKLDASGAGSANAGNGGNISLSAGSSRLNSNAGSLRNSGDLVTKGGDSAGACDNGCSSGAAGSITLAAANGLLSSTGNLIATGGGGSKTFGNSGGSINIGVTATNEPNNNAVILPGSITLSGNIDASGGSSDGGGSAGSVTISLDTNQQPAGQEIVLYGYPAIRADGGAGVVGGGSAGTISFSNSFGKYNSVNNTIQVEGGSIVNYSDLSAMGGAAPNAPSGSSGGNISLTTQSSAYFPGPQFEIVLNAGAVNTSSLGNNNNGGAGNINFYGRNGVKNSGALTANGGSGPNTGDSGSAAGSVSLIAENGPVTNGAAISAVGGAALGTGTGGSAGNVAIIGYGTNNSGAINAAGGAGDVTLGNGGNGGQVLLSTFTGLSVNTAPAPAGIVVSGGAAKNPGATGQLLIDGRDHTSTFTH
jgi:collagen type VII alpha